MICASTWYSCLIIFCIILAGILVGIQSYPKNEDSAILGAMDLCIQYLFTSECVFKLFAEGQIPARYLTGPERGWNNFDFWLVLICWLPVGGNGTTSGAYKPQPS